jgi:hypothetical protein
VADRGLELLGITESTERSRRAHGEVVAASVFFGFPAGVH